MRNFKNPKRYMAICALAGPVSNILLAVLVVFVYGLVFGPLAESHTRAAEVTLILLRNTVFLNVMFAIFNLMPIPPLDGSKVLFSLAPDHIYITLMRYERFGMIVLIVLVLSGVFWDTIGVAVNTVFVWLIQNVGQFAFDLVN